MADYDAIIAVNTSGFFHITQLAIGEMQKHDGGHVVQITTTLADQANSQVPAMLMVLTKGGLTAAIRALAIEYVKRGIRVNAVAPDIIKTPLHSTETHAALDRLHSIGHPDELTRSTGNRAASRSRRPGDASWPSTDHRTRGKGKGR